MHPVSYSSYASTAQEAHRSAICLASCGWLLPESNLIELVAIFSVLPFSEERCEGEVLAIFEVGKTSSRVAGQWERGGCCERRCRSCVASLCFVCTTIRELLGGCKWKRLGFGHKVISFGAGGKGEAGGGMSRNSMTTHEQPQATSRQVKTAETEESCSLAFPVCYTVCSYALCIVYSCDRSPHHTASSAF